MMNDSQLVKPVRLVAAYAFLDTEKTHLWKSWPEGTVVTDPDDIKLLEAHGAPIEQVCAAISQD